MTVNSTNRINGNSFKTVYLWILYILNTILLYYTEIIYFHVDLVKLLYMYLFSVQNEDSNYTILMYVVLTRNEYTI